MKCKRCALTVDVESDVREINFSDVDEIYYLLDIFNELNIFCTFFFTGRCIEMMPKIVNHVARSGHEIALHGYAHDYGGNNRRKELMACKELPRRF